MATEAAGTVNERSRLDAFEQSYGFPFDPFQNEACRALESGSSVLVAAPTGAGKTVVGEFAAALALGGGGKTFYTTPIKALSNQKYADFVALHGAANVGLLTGDNSVNGDAPIVVMTTEVLRNMIYEDSRALIGLHYVVLDEVHYLQDRYRGAVWEEILIHLPVDVQIVALSATVSNAEEFGDWLHTLRGETEVIIEEHRPVEIRHWYFASDELLPMFVQRPNGDVIANPRGREFDRRRRRGAGRPGRGARRVREKRPRIPLRTEVVERLEDEQMLPAIYFIFSRRGCADAVQYCLDANVRLTTPDERRVISQYVEDRVTDLTPEELDVLGYSTWLASLTNGVAAHHAGMIPPFKETVEELFVRGLVKVVFATETLALGINMPARTVVIESVVKFTGEKHEMMTPGEYTQLSGRAGRRGIDQIGHSVVLLQRWQPFDAITRLASTRTYPLRSSFQPSYNMAVNLVRNYDRAESEHLVNSSFGQFQADQDVVRLERTREKSAAYLASYRERMQCDLGDFEEYRQLADELRKLEDGGGRGRAGHAIGDALLGLRPGDVFEIEGGKRRGRYAVLEVTQASSERRPRILALSPERSMVRFSSADFRRPPRKLARVRIPEGFDARDAAARRAVARRLAALSDDELTAARRHRAEDSSGLDRLRLKLETHACHACPDIGRHMHYAARATRLEREVAGIDRRIARRTGTLARRFEDVLGILETLGYVKEWRLTSKGETLTAVYNESDLLVVEALERRLLDDLEPAEIAAVCSTLVYETRGPELETIAELPTQQSGAVYRKLIRLWRSVRKEEDGRGLELTREPDAGFAVRAYRWASGIGLSEVLDEDDAPGDFVRSVKQLVDLLRQIEDVAPDEALRSKVRTAISGVQRGVVAYSSLDV